jgi:alpha-tubulin suppressor-like RCC1 family protein
MLYHKILKKWLKMSYLKNTYATSGLIVLFIVLEVIVTPCSGSSSSSEVGIIALSMSEYHTLALMSNGTVWAWGLNCYGECGMPNTTTIILSPIKVPGLYDVKAIAAGSDFSVVLKNDGTVWAWGSNSYGDIGNGDPVTGTHADDHLYPVMLPIINVIAIAAGDDYGMALRDDGTVWTWGSNNYGQLGNGGAIGDNSYVTVPTEVAGLSDIKAIYAGPSNAVAVKSDGTIWVWGRRDRILGEMMTDMKAGGISVPTLLFNNTDVKSMAIGDNHAVILKNNGTIWIWGDDWRGMLGNGSKNYLSASPDYTYTPIMVPGLSNVTAITAGIEHTVALESNGTVWAWGGNEWGELGDGTQLDRNLPVMMPISNVTYITAGGLSTAILDKSGVVWTCGSGVNGELGDGSSGTGVYKSSPVRVNVQSDSFSSIGPTISNADDKGGHGIGFDVKLLIAVFVMLIIIGVSIYYIVKKN